MLSSDIILRAHNVSKKFGGVVALDNLSIEVSQGEIVSLIGPNGSGKTTFINVVTGFIPPDSGDIWFNGKNIKGLPPDKITKYGLTRTFQEIRPLADLSPLENVLIGRLIRVKNIGKARRDALEILEFLGLDKKANATLSELTEMEIKLLGLARALATDPIMIMIDEIVAGLLPGEIDKVVEVIRRIRDEKRVTILLIEHVMRAVLSLADHVIVLYNGKKLAEGKPNDILKDKKVIEVYLGG